MLVHGMSYAGLTRVSILFDKARLPKQMDRRVKCLDRMSLSM
jgi:hypothetical protein